jgi:threonine/homoserine/homoserine lactone efflux protein
VIVVSEKVGAAFQAGDFPIAGESGSTVFLDVHSILLLKCLCSTPTASRSSSPPHCSRHPPEHLLSSPAPSQEAAAKVFSLRSAHSSADSSVFAAALGISAILAASAVAFHTVKYAGAAYLIFLGIKMLRSRNVPLQDNTAVERSAPSRGAFRQGILTEALNPKTALFFLSFIPQFIAPGRGHIFLQFATLGILSVTLNTAADLLVVALATPLERKLKSSPSFRARQRTASGLGMIGLGAYVALSDAVTFQRPV